MSSEHVLVGFSGGMDSCAAVHFLKEEGYRVTAVHLVLYNTRSGEGTHHLETVADHLNVPLIIADKRKLFRETIIKPFAESYLSGETPNPCVWCNEGVKLRVLQEMMPAHQATWIATGHYAKKVFDPKSRRWTICRGSDRSKDQSYFLSLVPQEHLTPLILPLGDRTKSDIRVLMQTLALPIPKDVESHEICFLEGNAYTNFITTYLQQPAPEGTFIDANGKVLGTHDGFFQYTIGQRRGIGIADRTPYYVTALHPGTNQVQIGKVEELYRSTFTVRECRWHLPPSENTLSTTCQIRYRHAAAPASVRILPFNRAEVVFFNPQRAITPGQVAAFYQGDRLIGAGIIEKSMP